MTACTRSYGVCVNVPFSDITHDPEDLEVDLISKTSIAKDQLTWLIKKDDLILSDQPKESTATFTKKVRNKNSTDGAIPIYLFDGRRDRIPDRLADAEGGSLINVISARLIFSRAETDTHHPVRFQRYLIKGFPSF